jgi:hypothetical protein
MSDGCYTVVVIAKYLRALAAAVGAGSIVAVAWAARSVPNEVRKSYGPALLLRALLPWGTWEPRFDMGVHDAVRRFRAKIHAICLIFATCALMHLVFAYLTVWCLTRR